VVKVHKDSKVHPVRLGRKDRLARKVIQASGVKEGWKVQRGNLENEEKLAPKEKVL
jgi:hypothetical protein